MSQKSQREITVEGLKKRASLLANIEVEKITRHDLGEAGFSDVLDDAKAIKKFTKRVDDCTWNGVPQQVIQTCSNKLNELMDAVQQIIEFKILGSGNLSIERNNRIAGITNVWSQTYVFVAPHLCFAESVDSGADRYAVALAEVEAVKDKLIADKERMVRLVEDVEQMAQKSGVSNQAYHFKELADQYRTIALCWVGGAILAGICLFLYVHYLHFQSVVEPSEPSIVVIMAVLLPHLIMVTLLSTALFFCLRNYSAMMHNMIVNRHRQTALTTFQTFVDSTVDAGTRNSVLVQSTQAIFSPQPSGFLKTETEMPQVNQVTEIVRSIAGADK